MKIKKIVLANDKQAEALEKINEKIPFPLPKLHFNMLLLASRNSGKTSVIINLLLQGYKHIFNSIFVFSPTVFQDSKWKALKIDPNQLFSEYTDEYLQSIIDYQNEPGNEKANCLIVMDDCAGMFSKNSLINHFITRTRHHRISIIMSVQYSKLLLPVVRNNLTSICVFNNIKPEEVRKIEEILDPRFEMYYSQLQGESKYNFVYISDEYGIMFNFDNLIYDKNGDPHEPNNV